MTSSGRFFSIGIFALIALFAVPDFVYAQPTLDRIQRRVEQKVNQRLQREVDKTIDRALDKSIESAIGDSKSKKDKADEFSDGVIFEAKDEKPREVKPNNFIGSFTFNVEEYKRNGKLKRNGKGALRFTNDTWQTAQSILDENGKEVSRLIYHTRDNYVVSIDPNEGEGYIMTPPRIKLNVSLKATPEYTYNKTGRSKTIHGYLCEEYAYTVEDVTGTSWHTKDLPEAMMETMFNFFSLIIKNDSKNQWSSFLKYGIILENESTHKNGEKSTFYISNIEVGKFDPTIFDLSQYNVQDLRGMHPFGG